MEPQYSWLKVNGYVVFSSIVLIAALVALAVKIRRARVTPGSFRDPNTLAVIYGIIWGILIRCAFAIPPAGGALATMSVGFLVFIPLAIGYVTIAYHPNVRELRYTQVIFLPWIPTVSSMIIAGIIGFEGSICLVMAAPGWLLLASIGGALGRAARRAPVGVVNVSTMMLLLSPPVVSYLEGIGPGPLSRETVMNEITIAAPPEEVWRNIRSVERIASEELPPSFVHLMGFPDPIEATLDRDGLGGIRHARFDGGVVFTETVTEWKPERVIAFTIRANTAQIPKTTLDEHVTIGGPYFDTLNGRYEIVPAPEGRVLLKLSSEHRLSTRFNLYARLWSRFIMSSIQRNILTVIKNRCEGKMPVERPAHPEQRDDKQHTAH